MPKRTPREQRIVSRQGIPNVSRIGLQPHPMADIYHFALRAPWSLLLGGIGALYLVSNALFALIYLVLGGINNARPGSFADAFFFSVQTMSTIGYGQMWPLTMTAHLVVTLEALVGLLALALVTGLIFSKFARPTARIMFSKVAVISQRDGVSSLMFRMANERRDQIVEATAHLVFIRNEQTVEGERVRRFRDLKLTQRHSAVFFLTWTAVHPITPDSPLYGQTPEDLAKVEAQVMATVTGTDETLSQTVHARYSYTLSDIVWGHRLADIISVDSEGRRSVNYNRFHDTIPVADSAAPALKAKGHS
jgi:inward rectifier potassium channel